MKTKVQINSIWGNLLFEFECSSIKDCLVEAVKHGADLHGADLYCADLYCADLHGADLHGADLHGANLHGANLLGADLHGADLYCADLYCANLYCANLYGANLYGANLLGANLLGAKNLEAKNHDSLNILRRQKNPLIAYKYVTKDLYSPTNGHLKYEVGSTVEEKQFCHNDLVSCGEGLNIASLEWCVREFNIDDNKIIEVEFDPQDIVSIPYNTDGKFRVSKLKVIRKLTKTEIKKFMNKKYE